MEKNISNHEENYTRFFLTGKKPLEISEEKNIRSAILIAADEPGSLLKALTVFDVLRLNLIKLRIKTNSGVSLGIQVLRRLSEYWQKNWPTFNG